MLKHICTDTLTLRKWLKSGYVDKKLLYPTDEGTPQGGIISPTLANLVLDGLEDLLISRFGRGHGPKRSKQTLANRCQVHFVRYADDFVITGNSKELLENEIRPLVCDFLAERGLTLSEEKTRVTHISEGFDFLGQNVRKYRFSKTNAKLLIKPSKKNLKTFLDWVWGTIRQLRTARQDLLIKTLNPKIQGWANYHSHVVAKETYSKVDNIIWHRLWAWACRRHPNKPKGWILRRYFGQVGTWQNVFGSKVVKKDGEKGLLTLRNAADVAIVRHVKIQGEANLYDPRFEEYFEKRSTLKMERRLAGRRKLLNLWRRQKGLCPVCAERITTITRWHVHHLVRRVDGGSDASSNLWLLHPDCHRQHHANPGLKWKLLAELED
jgi:RNA-directed DNA polymerase